MLRNLFWMVFSSAVRLGSGLVLFVLIARHLGPEEFGHYMFWYGLTLLFATLAGFGLGNMLLKEIAQHPETAAHTLGEALSLRLTLAVAVLCVAFIAAFFVDRPELLLLLLFANLVEIIAETFYVAYRAIGHYRGEAHVATAAAFLQLLLVVIAVLAYQKTGFIALVFLAGKVLQLVLILAAARHVFGKFRLASPRTGLRLAQRTKAYAADMLMGSAFGNIDSIVLRAFAGIETVGVYQSGMRIFQGGARAAPILANVFLPAMAKQAQAKKRHPYAVSLLQTAFLGFGAVFGLTLAYFSAPIVTLAFGSGYERLIALMPLFGLLFFIRFFVSAWGLMLTAAGQQAFRAKATAIHLLFLLTLGLYLAGHLHAEGWLIALILANVLLGVLYMRRAMLFDLGGSITLSAILTCTGILFFIPSFPG